MNTKGTYCEGSQCKKRDKCALHCVESGEYQYIDWSNYGGSRYWNDSDGTAHCEVDYSCGDNGNYKYFVEVTR